MVTLLLWTSKEFISYQSWRNSNELNVGIRELGALSAVASGGRDGLFVRSVMPVQPSNSCIFGKTPEISGVYLTSIAEAYERNHDWLVDN